MSWVPCELRADPAPARPDASHKCLWSPHRLDRRLNLRLVLRLSCFYLSCYIVRSFKFLHHYLHRLGRRLDRRQNQWLDHRLNFRLDFRLRSFCLRHYIVFSVKWAHHYLLADPVEDVEHQLALSTLIDFLSAFRLLLKAAKNVLNCNIINERHLLCLWVFWKLFDLIAVDCCFLWLRVNNQEELFNAGFAVGYKLDLKQSCSLVYLQCKGCFVTWWSWWRHTFSLVRNRFHSPSSQSSTNLVWSPFAYSPSHDLVSWKLVTQSSFCGSPLLPKYALVKCKLVGWLCPFRPSCFQS